MIWLAGLFAIGAGSSLMYNNFGPLYCILIIGGGLMVLGTISLVFLPSTRNKAILFIYAICLIGSGITSFVSVYWTGDVS